MTTFERWNALVVVKVTLLIKYYSHKYLIVLWHIFVQNKLILIVKLQSQVIKWSNKKKIDNQ